MENVIVKMDVRGFIRFPEEAVKALKLDKLATQTKTEDGRTVDVGPYVDVEVDPVGKRVAITPIKTPKSTSFQSSAPSPSSFTSRAHSTLSVFR